MREKRIFLVGVACLLLTTRLVAQPAAKATEEALRESPKELLGLWAGDGEVVEFRSDNKCKYGGVLYPYRVSQGHLLIETESGKVIFRYKVAGRQLTLTADGHQSVYTLVASPDQAVPPRKDARNPLDLVGQWCYLISSTGSFSGRCITLRADGTYTYQEESSRSVQSETVAGGTAAEGIDTGTWFIDGDRLYYQSRTQGSGFFHLERRNHPVNTQDPMIVLDNEPFVTTVSRPPWR